MNDLIGAIGKQFMRDLARDLVSVQPMNITDPATNENIFTYTYEKAVFDRKSRHRWDDDGGPPFEDSFNY